MMSIGGVINLNLGYQLVTKNGFVLNVAAGPMYGSLTHTLTCRIFLCVGFAF